MFNFCKQLRVINLINAIFPDNLEDTKAFNVSKNLVVFTRDEGLIEFINDYECAIAGDIINENWRVKQKKINTEDDSCIDDCAQCSYKYEYESYCYEQCPDGTIPNKNNKCFLLKLDDESKDKDDLVKNAQSFIDSGLELSDINRGNDIEIKDEGIIIVITSTENQKNDKNKNKTIINLKECEDILKDIYNISKNESLYILKIDIEQKGMKIPKIEYEVYYPLNGTDLTKLNLSYCQEVKIDLLIPSNIDGNIDKYNTKSDYYNSICSKSDSDNGIDIPLSDRKDIFLEQNLSLCEENCDFIKYDYDYKKVECSCEIKITLPIINDVKIDKEKLKKNFIDIKNIININIMKCYKTVLTINNLKNNYGFFIILFIILFYYICFFSFYCKYYKSLKKLINTIISAKKNIFKFELKNKSKKNITFKKKIIINKIVPTKRLIFKKNKNNIKKYIRRRKNNKINRIILFPKNKYKSKITTYNSSKNKIMTCNNSSKLKSNKLFKESKNLINYTDNELNSLSYKESLIYDKRTYCQYYLSLLRTNNLLVFTFCSNNDYNSTIIKIFLFFYFFSVHFTINTLFFNDSTMHKIYEDNGSFNFIYQIPQIIYSTIISTFFNTLIKFLALSENNIILIKQEKIIQINMFDKRVKKVFDTLKIKFILFFIITFFILILFLYYITCFCGIYTNTQIHLIKDTIISFVLSLLYPLGICMIPGLFRILALKDKKKNKKCIFIFSKLLTYI